MQRNTLLSTTLSVFMLFASVACRAADPDPVTPVLSGFTLGGFKGRLNPAFDPDVTRYSIISSAEDSAVSVTPSAQPGVVIEVNGLVVPGDSTVNLGAIAPGDSFQISAKQNGEQTSYEVHYLPSDFPYLKAKMYREGVSENLIYISAAVRGADYTYLINLDNNAVPTFYRRLDEFAADYKLHEATGERSYSVRKKDRNQWNVRNGEIVILNSNGQDSEVIETVGLSHTDMHDFLITCNNELVLLSYDGVFQDLSDQGIIHTEVVVQESVIQIIDRITGMVKFEWRSLDEIPYGDQLYKRYKSDYAHINSVVVDDDGNLLASLRGTSNIVKIDRASGRILWKFGGKANQFTFIDDPFTGTCGQHTATWLDNGNMLVFDNGQQCLPEDDRLGVTRVVEYELDEKSLTAELVWSYEQKDQYSVAMGSAQRLTNGNTLIAWGRRKETLSSILVTEVNQKGDKLFEISTDSETPVLVYRAYRFPE